MAASDGYHGKGTTKKPIHHAARVAIGGDTGEAQSSQMTPHPTTDHSSWYRSLSNPRPSETAATAVYQSSHHPTQSLNITEPGSQNQAMGMQGQSPGRSRSHRGPSSPQYDRSSHATSWQPSHPSEWSVSNQVSASLGYLPQSSLSPTAYDISGLSLDGFHSRTTEDYQLPSTLPGPSHHTRRPLMTSPPATASQTHVPHLLSDPTIPHPQSGPEFAAGPSQLWAHPQALPLHSAEAGLVNPGATWLDAHRSIMYPSEGLSHHQPHHSRHPQSGGSSTQFSHPPLPDRGGQISTSSGSLDEAYSHSSEWSIAGLDQVDPRTSARWQASSRPPTDTSRRVGSVSGHSPLPGHAQPSKAKRRNSFDQMSPDDDDIDAVGDSSGYAGTRQDKRRHQNKLAQRAFRARTKMQTAEHNSQLMHLIEVNDSQSRRLEEMTSLVAQLQKENLDLKLAAINYRLPADQHITTAGTSLPNNENM